MNKETLTEILKIHIPLAKYGTANVNSATMKLFAP